MKTIYTRPVCPACHVLKAKLTKEGVPFEAITVVDDNEPLPPGAWISRQEFARDHPEVRSFPFVVED
jgi:glutaredoxin